jgi:hypothetical protein
MKVVAIMASISSVPDRSKVSLEAFGKEVLARRAAAGNPELPRNAGANRTASKKALLKAIEDAGGKW